MIKQTGPGRWRLQDPMGPLWLLVLGALGAGGTGLYALWYGGSRALRGHWDAESLITGSALVVGAVLLTGVVAWVRAFPHRHLRIDSTRRQVTVWSRTRRVVSLPFDQALPVRSERVLSKTSAQRPAHWEIKISGYESHVYWATSAEAGEEVRERLQALLASGQDGPAQEDP